MQWDDALDFWRVHGVGGVSGTICLGIFASKLINEANGADGLLYGGSAFFLKEVCAVAGASLYAFLFTWLMLIIINAFTPVVVRSEDEEAGLDESVHGEVAYVYCGWR